MQQRHGGIDCRNGIDYRRQRPVRNLDAFARIQRGVATAVARQNHRGRLADIAHAIDREATMFDRRFDCGRERVRPALASSTGMTAMTLGRTDAATMLMESNLASRCGERKIPDGRFPL